jgi:Fur family transcriptional regulator, ferric uptake regulator
MIKHTQPTTQAHEWLKCLADNGYRLTAPRRAVVEIIAASQHVLNPYDVFVKARKRHPSLGLVTVYRTVDKLEELNLIQRVHQPSGCQAFITAFSGHQHLLICDECGRVEFFEGDDINPLMKTVGEKSGFDVHGHWLQLFGMCQDCRGGNA